MGCICFEFHVVGVGVGVGGGVGFPFFDDLLINRATPKKVLAVGVYGQAMQATIIYKRQIPDTHVVWAKWRRLFYLPLSNTNDNDDK